MDREQVIALQHQRFATKKYDPNRRISQKDWEALVEVGRLAPSSVGLEPWKGSEPFCHLSCAKRRYL